MVVELTPDELERKWQGLVVQRSQTELLFAQAGHEVMREFLERGGVRPRVPVRKETDMPKDTATVERFARCVRDFADQLAPVRDEQWTNATPCTDWDVRALVNHVTGELAWVQPLVAGQTIAEVGDRFDG